MHTKTWRWTLPERGPGFETALRRAHPPPWKVRSLTRCFTDHDDRPRDDGNQHNWPKFQAKRQKPQKLWIFCRMMGRAMVRPAPTGAVAGAPCPRILGLAAAGALDRWSPPGRSRRNEIVVEWLRHSTLSRGATRPSRSQAALRSLLDPGRQPGAEHQPDHGESDDDGDHDRDRIAPRDGQR